ncbi:hypothetical protein [Propionivibrio sp.]|uniref:hypothetical protein n=1 Tax=Propionivibrio sp. TaxID=2212460 RepID=UPI003BF0140F
MGQSKPIYPLDSLISEAIVRRKQKNKAEQKNLDLPTGAKFAGYLIFVHSTKEFLNQVEDSPKESIRKFAETPEYAHRFESLHDANKSVRPENGESVVALFKLGQMLIVAQVNNELGGGGSGETLH